MSLSIVIVICYWLFDRRTQSASKNQTLGRLGPPSPPTGFPSSNLLVNTLPASLSIVSVTGEVRYPGQYPFPANVTIVKAIQLAGGFTESASSKRVRLIREDGQTFVVNCDKAAKAEKLDLPLYPGDIVLVERR